MLSYRHHYHAGNHADVLKHSVLNLIISALREKEKPFLYLDTHAGAGGYMLENAIAARRPEHLDGVTTLWQQHDLPPEILPYLETLRAFNANGKLQFYPGSPLIARHLLRHKDRLALSELHPNDVILLQRAFRGEKRAKIVHQDGYQYLKSQLPPVSRRGVILMDPSYELKSDYEDIINALKEGVQRFQTGTFMIWYPVVFRRWIQPMEKALKKSNIRRILHIELAIEADTAQRGMTASGLFIVNPPWKLMDQMQNLLPWLHQVLVPQKKGFTRLEWLVPE